MPENPWPDFSKGQRRTIKTILMELGSGIEEKTEGAIKFLINTSVESDQTFKHYCQLYVVPIDYIYPLFVVTHAAEMFPVTTISESLGQQRVSNDENQLAATVKEIIQSRPTRVIVEQLLDAAT